MGQGDGRVRRVHGRDEPQHRHEPGHQLRKNHCQPAVHPYHTPGDIPSQGQAGSCRVVRYDLGVTFFFFLVMTDAASWPKRAGMLFLFRDMFNT